MTTNTSPKDMLLLNFNRLPESMQQAVALFTAELAKELWEPETLSTGYRLFQRQNRPKV